MTAAWPVEPEESDDESLERLEQRVAALRDALCVACQRTLCGHEALFNVALGLATAPRCVSCLAAGLAMSADGLRDHLWSHFQRRACYGQAWRRANEREGFPPAGLPTCLWPNSAWEGVDLRNDAAADAPTAPGRAAGNGPEAGAPPLTGNRRAQEDIAVAEHWDAGDMGCGDLVLALRLRMAALPSGATLRLVARDPGAKEDIPAWCRLTGHKLLAQDHPQYWIQRKE